MNPASEHLSGEEINLLLGTADGPPLPAGRIPHLEICEVCTRRLAVYRENDARLRKLAKSALEPPSQHCPAMDQWERLTGGLLDDPRREELLEHASGCDGCGAALQCTLEDLSGEATESEGEQIRQLRTASKDWQRGFARRICSDSKAPTRPARMATWLSRAAAVLIVLGGGWLGYLRVMPSPARLLARAYTEQRPFELRIPGAEHAPVRIEKRAQGSSFNRPAALLDAQAKIARELQGDPDSVQWLALKARVEMLNWDPEAALATLNRALEQKPDDPDLLAELGVAYALRAETQNRAIDYGRAMEYLSRSLRAKPNSTETLFNRALVYQRMFLYEEAIKDWRRYLELDPKGGWAEEARRRMAEIEQKKKVRQEALDKITDDPVALLRRLDAGEPVEPESYLEIAVTRWLPRRWEGEAYDRALEKLAVMFESRHRDRWLRDVLAARRSDEMVAGLRELGDAFSANLSDDSKRALGIARGASERLRRAGSEVAALRADTEHVYALRRTFAASECVSRALDAERRAEAAGYSWILGQVRIELGICRMIPGDAGSANDDLDRALASARTSGYRSLELRAAGILTGVKTNSGNLLGAWEAGRDALAVFWDGVFVGTRAQQVYLYLGRPADALGLSHAGLALARSCVNALQGTSHRTLEGLNRTRVARLATQSGFPHEAAEEYRRAEELFRLNGLSRQAPENLLEAQVGRAQAEASSGDLEAARNILAGLREQASKTKLTTILLPYYRVMGEVQQRSNSWLEVEQSYRAAIERSEARLASLRGFQARAAAIQSAGYAYRGLAEVALRSGDWNQALRLWEWFRSGEQTEPRIQRDLDLHELRKETFLAYADLPGGMVVWAFDDRGIEGRRLSTTTAEIEKTATRFARLCADPKSNQDAMRRDARQLYDWLVAPIEHRLNPARTVIIEPDGAIAAIPMQALIDPNNRFLSDRFSTVTSSGLTDYLQRVRAPAVSAQDRALVVASPTLSQEMTRAFPPLSQASREGDAITARFSRAMLVVGSGATLSALERLRPEAEILHFAGHGFSHSGNGGLLLAPADRGSLGADVLDGVRLAGQDWSRCRLAVLSACSSGTGETSGPVNPESLVRRMLWSGISRVVASRWNADAETGLIFMDSFYSSILSGADVAVSLQRAASHIRENEATRHPYFWAGFQVFGSR